MVKRFEPCHKYFDQWDEDGYSSCSEAKNGEYVLYATYKNEMDRMTAQVERLKKQVSVLNQTLKEQAERNPEVQECFE